MKVVEFTRFQCPAEKEQAVLAARAASVTCSQAQHPELRDVLLIRLEGGDWLDVAVWIRDDPAPDDDRTGRDSVDAELPRPSARDAFFAVVGALVGEERGLVVDRSSIRANW